MKAQFKKLPNGEWRVACSEKVDFDLSNTIIVSMASGTTKQVKLSPRFSRDGDLYLYIPENTRPVATTSRSQRPYQQDRYESKHVSGVCSDCEFNADAGDMQGCPRHRGNPHS